MSSPAIPLSDRALLWIDRTRGLLTGLGYAVALTSLLFIAYTLQDSLDGIVSGAGLKAVLRTALASATHHARDMFPGPLLIVIGVNLAPRAGLGRLGWFLLVACLCATWAQVAKDPGLQNPAWLRGILATMLDVSLLLAVCAYHNHVQGAADRLLRIQIDGTTLDTELKRAQLQLLRAQIEPHFLFNTLSAVRTLARTDRIATVEMLNKLIRYFEAAMTRLAGDKVPLKEEMRLIDAYLGIYRVRMGARLAYEIALPADLADIAFPPMMLLTLVENALKHGVNPLVEGGFIRVSASRVRSSLLLKVSDSGRGMSARHGHGMGLANVRQRLMTLYGDTAVLSLSPAEPRGVVATLSIPCTDVA
jgi:signal transduction histidine kinase